MNELVLADKIEKRLQEKREPTIFPLASNHRKELRHLRDTNIGDLRDQLHNIRSLKREEYEKKYSKHIENELKKHEKTVKILNDDWKERLKHINKIISDRKELEEKYDTNKISFHSDYSGFAKLEAISPERKFYIQSKEKSLEIARDEFEDAYGDKFRAVEEKIGKIVTQYEEAINFGDLEIVKNLYYMMKKADDFFIKVTQLKI